MAANNDTKAMIDEYTKGVTIDDIASKYGYTVAEVTAAVVKDVPAPTPVLQADISEAGQGKK